MAFTVKLLNFQKRENSTKQPTAAQLNAASSFDCLLLDETSLFTPTFKLTIDNNPIGNNYCYVADFNRYYFITDITSHQNFWFISCRCDVLASFKSEILSGSHYVLRSASNYDEYIMDTIYPSKIKETGTFTSITDPFAYTRGHSYVWCITGDVISDSLVNQQIGSNVYYWMDDRECYTFINYLLENIEEYSDIQAQEYSVAMQKALLNPMQYVNSVILLPFNKDNTLATNNNVKFGYYTIGLNEESTPPPAIKRITQGTMTHDETITVTIPKHPQAATRGKFMNNAPYTAYEIFLGPFGTIPIDPASLIDETSLQIYVNTEVCTGTCQVFIRGVNTGVQIYTGTCQAGVPVHVSQITRDMLGEVQNNLNMQFATGAALSSAIGSGIAAGATTVASGGAAGLVSGASAYGGVMNSIMNIGGMAFDAVRLKYPTCTGGGANGSFMNMHSTSYLNAKFYEIVGENRTELGRPLYQTKTLSTLSGFCVCSGADAQISGTANEVVTINEYLNSGFFIE